jgi:(E)-4-hydroxy-3-methylbut-2-enyl-diphosphate synthase
MFDEKIRDFNYFNYRRRVSTVVQIGKTPLGGSYPIRLQSMTTTPTSETDESVEQCRRLVRAGADYVRLTAQGTREAENLKNIRQALHEQGIYVPLVADIHFNPDVALIAARIVEKVRINPGNFVDAARSFRHVEYTDEEYQAELKKIEERFVPFLHVCQEHHTAIRIGVNHGSLSDRIMSRYGDTPEGIVESCMEFLRICKKQNFREVVISIKASNTAIMVRSVRLLVEKMDHEGMHYPLHLGVTEAGNGEDGRIKSALGIGALLSDGIGDTIRVSLSEAPEKELPVARKLRDYIVQRNGERPIGGRIYSKFNFLNPSRRDTVSVKNIGGQNPPVVISEHAEQSSQKTEILPDYIYCGDQLPKRSRRLKCGYIVDAAAWRQEPGTYPCFSFRMLSQISAYKADLKFLFLPCSALDIETIECIRRHPELVIIAQSVLTNRVGELRSLIHRMSNKGLQNPVVLFSSYHHNDVELEDLQIESAADVGALLFDGLCDGLYLSNEPLKGERPIRQEDVDRISFNILQAANLRKTHTEYVSCPGCGRTLYNLEETLSRIKHATTGLKNLKIAVMGCIVNGPGEMADADYGYVGAARGKISLYRGKECVEKNIPEEDAVNKLLELLKKDGRLL